MGEFFMGLQKKAVLFFNGFILITCICISVLGYWMANRGFSAALNAKAEADMRMAAEVLDLTYEEGPGNHEWDFWDRYILKILDWLPLNKKDEGLNSGHVSK